MADETQGRLAIVTGASSGIGRELAKLCAEDGMEIIVCADEPEIEAAAREVGATPVQADLSTREGVEALWAATGGRPVDYLFANAGISLGHAFFDQKEADLLHVMNTNIYGTTRLVYRAGRAMRAQGRGRILITGSIVGRMPGPFQAVYNGSKAYLDSFSYALRNELKDSGVTVTCLMPGATETEVFARSDMEDTMIGKSPKAGPEFVAKTGYEAMMTGQAGVVPGIMNKVATLFAGIIPEPVLAQMHCRMAEPMH